MIEHSEYMRKRYLRHVSVIQAMRRLQQHIIPEQYISRLIEFLDGDDGPSGSGQVSPDTKPDTAQTDGKTIWLNPRTMYK